jgi:peptidoglycan/LPS O-acetylase OafA/YrhL
MKPTEARSWNGGRLASIDALRGIAALGVVLYHTVQQAHDTVPANLLKWPVIFVHSLSSFGYVGVFLFFVISGFCIHLQWARARAAGKSHQVRFGAFWKRRIRRLYPAYLIALGLYLGLTALTAGVDVTRFFIYDVASHLFMLHNLDPRTAYSINGVFWTLAIEEQLYLAYFLLLFLRTRWGWGPALIVCGAARVGWFFFSHGMWALFRLGVPIPEAAASHWLSWALGAVSVEAAFGLIKLPKWCRNLWLGFGALLLAAGISQVFPITDKDGFVHRFCWLVVHPAWGLGFFIILNRAFEAEKRWRITLRMPRIVVLCASLGVFSYSLYLTHELVIMQSWRFGTSSLPRLLNALLVVTPMTVACAWIFFQFCERPFMSREARASGSAPEMKEALGPVQIQNVPLLVED